MPDILSLFLSSSPLVLATIASFATLFGAAMAMRYRELSHHGLSLILATAAGAMLLMAAMQIITVLGQSKQPAPVLPATITLYLLLGVALYIVTEFAVNRSQAHANPLVPPNHHDLRSQSGLSVPRYTWLLLVALSLHNFPEGMLTVLAAEVDPHKAWPTALAIALHNIPEGVLLVTPLLAAKVRSHTARFYVVLATLAEVFGAVCASAILGHLSAAVLNAVLLVVAGFMAAIALDELWPHAKALSSTRQATTGLVSGFMVLFVQLAPNWL